MDGKISSDRAVALNPQEKSTSKCKINQFFYEYKQEGVFCYSQFDLSNALYQKEKGYR
jgi:hypothetical protein